VEGAISKGTATLVDIHIGRNIRAFRLERGLTTTELAQRVGVSRSQVESYEAAVNRVPASRLAQIADVLNVPLAVLIDGSDGVRSWEPHQVEGAPLPKPDGLRLLQAFNGVPNKRMRLAILHFFEEVAEV
jgi:transcriptional regulator with XRE-family HTH domain